MHKFKYYTPFDAYIVDFLTILTMLSQNDSDLELLLFALVICMHLRDYYWCCCFGFFNSLVFLIFFFHKLEVCKSTTLQSLPKCLNFW